MSAKRILQQGIDLLEGAVRRVCKWKYLASRRKPWSCGYQEYKYDFIGRFIDGPDLECFVTGQLPIGYGYRMDERFVEYPWFFSRLKDSEQTLLDAGSVLNFRQILMARQLVRKRLYISTLFYEGRPEVQPSPSYLYEDLRDTCFRDGFFDAICSLSTLEHIGLDNTKIYTPDPAKKENDRYAYLQAIRELRRILKPGGTLYLSMPFGTYKNHGWFQVFDMEMIDRLLGEFNPASREITFFRYEKDQWNVADLERCRDGFCFDPLAGDKPTADGLAFSRCVICLALTR